MKPDFTDTGYAPPQQTPLSKLREATERFLNACDEAGNSRELSLAKTNAEQALLWAEKHFSP